MSNMNKTKDNGTSNVVFNTPRTVEHIVYGEVIDRGRWVQVGVWGKILKMAKKLLREVGTPLTPLLCNISLYLSNNIANNKV